MVGFGLVPLGVLVEVLLKARGKPYALEDLLDRLDHVPPSTRALREYERKEREQGEYDRRALELLREHKRRTHELKRRIEKIEREEEDG